MKKWENPKLTNLAVSNTSMSGARGFSGWVICKGNNPTGERHCFWTSSTVNPEMNCTEPGCGSDIEPYCGAGCKS